MVKSNRGWTRKLFGALTILVASVGLGEETVPAAATAAAPAATVTASAAAPAAGSMIGILDLRPSAILSTGKYYTENLIELGYKFSPKVAVSYAQFFNTNIFDKDSVAGENGVSPTFPGGFIRTRVNKIYQNGNFDMGLQNRTYLPLLQAERDNGKIATIRQYVNFNQKVNETLSLTAAVIPIAHVYSRATGTSGKANPAFENRVYLIANVNITEKLSLFMPVMFHQTKARSAAGASNDGAWTFFAWINPEIGYQINDNLAVGIGYYSDNLVKSDLSGFDLSQGLKAGVTQVFATMNL